MELLSIRWSVFRPSKATGGPFPCLSKMHKSQTRIRGHFPFSTSLNWLPKLDFQYLEMFILSIFFADFPVFDILSLKYLKYRLPRSFNLF